MSEGIRVWAEPVYLPDHSDPDALNPKARRFAFGYKIRIENQGDRGARLLKRRWTIVDAHGSAQEVVGDGVIGEQPHLEPGESFEYQSWAPLHTSWGTMEGEYEMSREDGTSFVASVARFYLVAEMEPAAV